MWIYLLIGLFFLILALECYFKGGINALVTLLGVILAVNLSGWFGSLAFQWMGDKWWPIDEDPFWIVVSFKRTKNMKKWIQGGS